jgi:hypothetical protein
MDEATDQAFDEKLDIDFGLDLFDRFFLDL